jgi:hypothetical protein
MSVGVRVVLLVKDDAMGEHLYPYIGAETLRVYICVWTRIKSTKRWTFTLSKFDEPFGVRFHFENFWEPMSIGVKVILLVGGDIMGKYLHPYIESRTLKVNTNMCTMDKLTKRWTFTSPKIDKPFGARFHFENF